MIDCLDRELWLSELIKIVDPVLINLAADELRLNMPYYKEIDPLGKRFNYANLEAFGRVFNGLSPWLALDLDLNDDEFQQQQKYKTLVLHSFSNILNPKANDYVDFSSGPQCLVDAAYLCQGILRYPSIWKDLDEDTKHNLISELKKTRKYQVAENNWMLFTSMVEVTLLKLTNQCNLKIVNKGAIKFINKFYVGDSIYSDGKDFTFNYYNSFVIHPMLTDILMIAEEHGLKIKKYYSIQVTRQKRYAEVLERLISPEGTYPILGRTITCRLGAFHSLAHSILQNNIPSGMPYGQFRSAMTALLKRQFNNDTNLNYSDKKWLKIGFMGKQLSLAEEYINTGSSYHTTCFFLPLGLSKKHPFWQEEFKKWSSLRIWDGEEYKKDISILEKEKQNIAWLFTRCKNKLKRILK